MKRDPDTAVPLVSSAPAGTDAFRGGVLAPAPTFRALTLRAIAARALPVRATTGRAIAVRALVVPALLALLAPAPARAADLVRTWDMFTGISTVVIEDSLGQVLAEESWAGPLPAARTPDAEVIPLRLLARLRDQVSAIVEPGSRTFSPEAEGVLAWLRKTMGAHADAEFSGLESRWLVEIRDKETAHWCGTDLTSEGRCPSDCISPDGPLSCKGCGCAGTRTFDIELPTKDPLQP